MPQKMSKSQKAKVRKKRAAQKVKRMESQDARGIMREKVKHGFSPKVFLILKIISIVAVPVVYFIYSPLVMVCVLFSASLLIFAKRTENTMNHTFIKSNHIRIPKLDSIIAILVILITIAGTIISLNSSRHMPANGFADQAKNILKSLGSCLTGSRSTFRPEMGMHFGMKEPPEGLPSMPDSGFGPGNMPDMKELKMTDLPIEAVFSQMLSSISTVLLFSISVVGIITLVLFLRRQKKFNREMNEITEENTHPLTEEEFERLFMFGYAEEEQKEQTA